MTKHRRQLAASVLGLHDLPNVKFDEVKTTTKTGARVYHATWTNCAVGGSIGYVVFIGDQVVAWRTES